jgi:hypothetical protein
MIKELSKIKESIDTECEKYTSWARVDYEDYVTAISELKRMFDKNLKIKEENNKANPSTITINNDLLQSNLQLKIQNAEFQAEITALSLKLVSIETEKERMVKEVEEAREKILCMEKKVEIENQKASYAEQTYINAKSELSQLIEQNMVEHRHLIDKRREVEKIEEINKTLRIFFRNSLYSMQTKEKSTHQISTEFQDLSKSTIEGLLHNSDLERGIESLSIFDHTAPKYALRNKLTLHTSIDSNGESLISSFSVNPSQSIFATAGTDFLINVVSAKEKDIEVLATIVTANKVTSIDVFEKGSIIGYAYGNHDVHIASVAKSKNSKVLKTKDNVEIVKAFNNTDLISVEDSGLMQIWDFGKMSSKKQIGIGESRGTSIEVFDSKIYIGNRNGQILFSDPRDKYCAKLLQNTNSSPIKHIELFDFNYLAFGNQNSGIEIADIRSWKIVNYLQLNKQSSTDMNFRYGVGNYRALVGNCQGVVSVYDISETPEVVLKLDISTSEVPFVWYENQKDEFVALDMTGNAHFYVSV